MKYLLGFILGIIVATAVGSYADCCSAFNVPFDTQIEIERQMAGLRSQEPIRYPSAREVAPSVYADEPCRR